MFGREPDDAPADREAFLFDVRMALRQVPAGILRELGKRRLPGDQFAEKVVGEKILDHLLLCRWRIEHLPVGQAKAEERAAAKEELIAELKAMLADARRPFWHAGGARAAAA